MDQEIWKPVAVEFFNTHYEVSNLGRVRRSSYTNRTRPNMLIKQKVNKYGYSCVTLKNGQFGRKDIPVHRLVATAFLHPVFGKPQVNHIDGDKLNNKTSNLEFVDNKENRDHAIMLGLFNFPKIKYKRGESHHRAKLSYSEVEEIRSTYSSGEYTQQDLADKYGVDRRTISRAIKKLTYSPPIDRPNSLLLSPSQPCSHR